jgi:hypothetical protein
MLGSDSGYAVCLLFVEACTPTRNLAAANNVPGLPLPVVVSLLPSSGLLFHITATTAHALRRPVSHLNNVKICRVIEKRTWDSLRMCALQCG